MLIPLMSWCLFIPTESGSIKIINKYGDNGQPCLCLCVVVKELYPIDCSLAKIKFP